MSLRSFRLGRSVTGLGLFATKPIKQGVYIATYRGRRITTEEDDRREARGAKYQFEINNRWLTAMERCPLHQSFLSAECKTSRTKGRDRDRGTTPNRARRGNHLRLWAAVCEILFGEWWLPLPGMPQKESSSSPQNSPPPQA